MPHSPRQRFSTGNQALPQGQKACIIGAGFSGLAAAKILQERGLPYDHYEMSSDVGGLWRQGHESGRSAAYDNLYALTSASSMELTGLSFPGDVPTFPSHEDVLRYIQSYADHFGLRRRIAFDTKVERALPTGGNSPPDGPLWTVTLESGSTKSYGALLVATGHHWHPRLPEAAGSFGGRELHAHDYRRPEPFSGKKVLVVGIGNSGTGIAADVCRVASKTTVSARSGAWILPKRLLGIPLDQWSSPYMERLPLWVRRAVLQLLRTLAIGSQERYGVPTPDHKPLEEHPTLNDEFLSHVEHGRIEMRPGLKHMDGTCVYFADESVGEFDVVLYATGYRVSFPFLPEEVFQPGSQEVGLYRYVVSPDWPGLYFLGLVQPAGPLPPLSERQAEWIADLLEGSAALPPPEAMRTWIRNERRRREDRYTSSPRHALEIDFWDYVRQLKQERDKGRQWKSD